MTGEQLDRYHSETRVCVFATQSPAAIHFLTPNRHQTHRISPSRQKGGRGGQILTNACQYTRYCVAVLRQFTRKVPTLPLRAVSVAITRRNHSTRLRVEAGGRDAWRRGGPCMCVPAGPGIRPDQPPAPSPNVSPPPRALPLARKSPYTRTCLCPTSRPLGGDIMGTSGAGCHSFPHSNVPC